MVKPPKKQPAWVDAFFESYANSNTKGCKGVADAGRAAFKRHYTKFAHAAAAQKGDDGEGDDDKPKRAKPNALASAVRAAIKNGADEGWWTDASDQVAKAFAKAEPADVGYTVRDMSAVLVAASRGVAANLSFVENEEEGGGAEDHSDGASA